jgi:hypothetical protein
MTPFEVREHFSSIVSSYLLPIGFTVKEKSKRGMYVIYEYGHNQTVTYQFTLSYTSHLSVTPTLQVFHKEIVDIIRQLDKEYYKTEGWPTFSSTLFEYFDPRNADGYMNVTAGHAYLDILQPYEELNIGTQAKKFWETTVAPVVNSFISKTNSIEKADKIINEDFILKERRTHLLKKKRLFTSVLCPYIPNQMMMSLLLAKLFNRKNLPLLLEKYSKYYQKNLTENGYMLVLFKRVINHLS